MFDETTRSQSVNVNIVEDNLDEGDEFIYLNLTVPNIQRKKRLTASVGEVEVTLPADRRILIRDAQRKWTWSRKLFASKSTCWEQVNFQPTILAVLLVTKAGMCFNVARDSQPWKTNKMELLPKVLHKWIPTVWIFTIGDKPSQQWTKLLFNYRRDWLIGACAYCLQQQENMRLLYARTY